MFNLTEETREAIIAILRNRLGVTTETHSDADINTVIDEVVDTVKAQFGF